MKILHQMDKICLTLSIWTIYNSFCLFGQRRKFMTIAKNLVKTEKILHFIKENKLTKREFAERCGIKVWNLQKVLSGNANIDVVYLFKIAKIMKIEIFDLLN